MSVIGKYLTKHRPVHLVDWQGGGQNITHRVLLAMAGMILFFLMWAIGGYLIFTRPQFSQFSGFLPGPTFKALIKLVENHEFWASVVASLRRISFGIGVAFTLGLPTGLLIGYFRSLRTFSYTPIQFVRMISPLSWMPIALLIFSTFESAIYFLITMATVWPIVLNSSLGVSRVNPRWVNMARNQGANDAQVLLYIVLPAAIPYILTSLRMALGVAWIVLVPVEFLGISSGLGYIINDARDTMEYDRLMAIVIAIGVIGFFLDGSIQLIQKMFRWNWMSEK